MKKILLGVLLCLANVFCLTGCSTINDKEISLSVIYGVIAILSFVPLIWYCLSKKRELWFVVLLSAVFVVNIGYFALSVSSSVGEALLANRISYLGSVFLPLSIFMILLRVAKINYNKWLPGILIALSVIVFFIAASPGYSTIYYKEVTLAKVNGATVLEKVYGPLHIIYLIFLLGYFITLIATTIYAFVKKAVVDTASSIFLILATFVNIAVWFFEQIAKFDFEFLSISYLITELFLLSLTFALEQNQKVNQPLPQNIIVKDSEFSKQQIEFFVEGVKTLTPTEKAIFEAHLNRITTKEIMASFNITENTLKFHNKNIYGKLGVSSKKQLLEINKYI